MLPGLIANQTVHRLRGTTVTDSHGNVYVSWATPAELAVEGCSVQPETGAEILTGRDSVTSIWRLYAPPDADITSTDRVRHGGKDYEVDGSIQDWPDIFGLGHKFCFLKLVEG